MGREHSKRRKKMIKNIRSRGVEAIGKIRRERKVTLRERKSTRKSINKGSALLIVGKRGILHLTLASLETKSIGSSRPKKINYRTCILTSSGRTKTDR